MQPKVSISGFFSLLLPWHNRQLVEQVGGEVARECRADIWQRGYRCTGSMSIAAIRGYVRAQAGGCVRSKVDQIASHHGLKPALRARVTDAAIEQLVGMVLHDFLCGASLVGERSMAA
jgi:hypothetical protein